MDQRPTYKIVHEYGRAIAVDLGGLLSHAGNVGHGGGEWFRVKINDLLNRLEHINDENLRKVLDEIRKKVAVEFGKTEHTVFKKFLLAVEDSMNKNLKLFNPKKKAAK